MSSYGTVGGATGFRRIENKDEFDRLSTEASDLIQYIRNKVGELGRLQKNPGGIDNDRLLVRVEEIVNDCFLKAANASTVLTQLQDLVHSSGDRNQEVSARRINQSLQSTVEDMKRKVEEIKSNIENSPTPRPKQRGFQDSTDNPADSSHLLGRGKLPPYRDVASDGSDHPLSAQRGQQQLHDEHDMAAIAERTRTMEKLEQDITGLNELMRDIAFLVAEQGEIVGRIEDAVEQAHTGVVKGNQQLLTAISYKKCSRKLTCIIVTIVVVVLVIIIISIIIGVCGFTSACKKN